MDINNQARDAYLRQQWKDKCSWQISRTRRVERTYPMVRDHIAFNINLKSMYNDGERFCHTNRDENQVGPNMYRLFLAFLHIIDDMVTQVSLPGMTDSGDIVTGGGVGANAGGAGLMTVNLDAYGNVVNDEQARRGVLGRLSDYTIETIRTFNDTMQCVLNFIEGCDSGMEVAADNAQQNEAEHNGKGKGKNKKTLPLKKNANRPRVPRQSRSAMQSTETTRVLPPVEIVFEKVTKCEPMLRKEYLKTLRQRSDSGRSKQNDSEQEENAGILEMTLNTKRRKVQSSAWEECASWHGYEMDDDEDSEDEGVFEDSVIELSRRAKQLWNNDIQTMFSDPKFCAFVEACELLDGRSVTDITIHCMVRVDVDINGFMRRMMMQNQFTSRISSRNTNTITKNQNRMLLLSGTSKPMIAGSVDPDDAEDLKANKSSSAPRPNNMRLDMPKHRMLHEWEAFRTIVSAVDLGYLVDCYSGNTLVTNEESQFSCDRLFDYAADHPLHALQIFSLRNALRNRDKECHPMQSIDAWVLKPDIYIDYSKKTNRTFTVNFPFSHNLIPVNPEELNPANVVFKYLPNVQEAENGFFRNVYPQLQYMDNENLSLLSHYHPVTYPYDPQTVVPVRIGDRYLTLEETEQAKSWLEDNGWDWRKSKAKRIRGSLNTSDSRASTSNSMTAASVFENALGVESSLVSPVPVFIRSCDLNVLYTSVRKHMNSLVKLQQRLAAEIKAHCKLVSSHTPSDSELRSMVEANVKTYGRGIAERSMRMFGGAIRPDDHSEFQGTPKRDGFLITELRNSHTQLLKSTRHLLKRLKRSCIGTAGTERSIERLLQLSGCNTYDNLACGQYSNISDSNLVLVEYERVNNVRLVENRIPYDKFDVCQSNLTNFCGHLLYKYLKFEHCHRPGLLFTMWVVSLDTNRDEFGTHMNLSVVGDGALGKSHGAKILANELRVMMRAPTEEVTMRSTTEEVSAETSCAMKVNSQGLMNGRLTIVHEFPRNLMVSVDENGGANNVWKDLVDKGYSITNEAHLDENGNVILRKRMHQQKGVRIILINWNPSGVEESAVQRQMWKFITKDKEENETVQSRQASEEQSKGSFDEVIKNRLCRQHHFIQIAFYHAFTLNSMKVFHISSSLAMYVILTICQDLSYHGNVVLNPRATTYLMLGAKIFMLMDIITSEFLTPGGRFYNKPFTTENLTALEPEMYVNTHHIVASIGTFSPYCMTQGQREVRLALNEIFKREIHTRQSIPSMFKQIVIYGADAVSANGIGNEAAGQKPSLFSGKSDRQFKHDFNYVSIPMSCLDHLCERIINVMRDLTNVESIYASRTVAYILSALSKASVMSYHYITNPNDPTGFPQRDPNQSRKNIPVMFIRDHSVEVSYEFLKTDDKDPEVCIIKSLRKLFNAYHQPPTEYAWKPHSDCTHHMDTIWLGEGLSSTNFENNIPCKNDKETTKLVLPDVGNISEELLKYIYPTPEEIEENRYKTNNVIEIDAPMDAWAAYKHHEKIAFRANKVTRRDLMKEFWMFGDRIANVREEKKPKSNKNIAQQIGIPKNIMDLAKLPQPTSDGDIPDCVKRILDTYDDEDDIDVPKDQFMVPVFENDADYLTRFKISKRKLNVEAYVPHWEVFGMTIPQYKFAMSLPKIREDRINRHHAAKGIGYDTYPEVVMKQPEPLHVHANGKNEEGEGPVTTVITTSLLEHYGLDDSSIFKESFTKSVKNTTKRKRYTPIKTTAVSAGVPVSSNSITPQAVNQVFDLSGVFEDSMSENF